MSDRSLKVVCAWCNRVVTMAPNGTPITHTICPTCLDFTIAHRTGTASDASLGVSHIGLPIGYFGNAFKR